MTRDFMQIGWDAIVEDDCRQLVRLAVREDLERKYDWTTLTLVGHEVQGQADVVVRQPGILAGLPAARIALEEMAPSLTWIEVRQDGDSVEPGDVVARMEGPARHLLTCERIVLNFLGRLSGIATLTRRYVEAVAGTQAAIYDTRKTTPGWRRLEKYAVRCGGGNNHRTGLFDGVLIKDNHLAIGARGGEHPFTPDEAVRRAKQFVRQMSEGTGGASEPLLVEIEVDSLDQLKQVLPAGPDLVLLDNMSADQLREAVAIRNTLASEVQLEASGGINLNTVAAVATTGVERISVGALTHSAVSLDLALDWND